MFNKNCFVPGMQILMEDGSSKNIENVKPGDMVITHKNRSKKILRKLTIPHNDNIIELFISNNESISCTKNHPFFIARNKTGDSNYNRVYSSGKSSFIFVDANKIRKTDILLQPVIERVIKSDISDNKARILGLYAAEGNLHRNNGVIFSFGIHEKDNLVQECKNLIEKEYNQSHCTINVTKSQPTKCTLYCYYKPFFDDCKKMVGELSSKKCLHSDLVFANENVKKNFIQGWLEGDGHVDKFSGKVVGTTVSKNLANQVRVMLNSLHINNSFYKEKPSIGGCINDRLIKGKTPIYRIKVSYNYAKDLIKNSSKLNYEKSCLDRKPVNFINGYKRCSFISKNEHFYKGDVYFLEVEDDNSYVINGIIAHNYNGDN